MFLQELGGSAEESAAAADYQLGGHEFERLQTFALQPTQLSLAFGAKCYPGHGKGGWT